MANPFPQNIAWPGAPTGDFVSFASGSLEARIYNASGQIELAGPDLAGADKANLIHYAAAVEANGTASLFGAVVSSSLIANGIEVRQNVAGAVITAQLTFPNDGVMRYEVTDWGGLNPTATAIASLSLADEQFYGFGERFDAFSQAGKKLHLLTFDQPGTKIGTAYKVSPWFVSTRGYGLHLDSSAECDFDMRSTANDRYIVTNPLGALRVNLVYGPLLTDVLTRFTEYAGRPQLPPPWVFGPWISSDVWRSGGEVRYAVSQFRSRNIPVSAFVFDSPWEIAYNDFQFNLAQFGKDDEIDGMHFDGFASLQEMMTFLQTNGLKVICWMAPFVNVNSTADVPAIPGQNLGKSANYDDGASKNVFVRAAPGGAPLVVNWWKGSGSPIDFTNPAARTWVTDQLNDLIRDCTVTTASGAQETAIGGFKTDDGESGNGPNTYIPTTAQYFDGRTGVEMRNGYCVEYHRAIAGVLGDNGILFARSGFIGSQAAPGSWAGDNEPNFGLNGLPGVIVAGQTAAMSAYAIWGHDVGGYQETNPSTDPANLFMRWAQFGCFSPLMQMHRQVSAGKQYPWRYGDAALNNYQFYTSLHTRLFPYIYTYANLAHTTGLPLIRPLVLLDQTDPNTFTLEHTYRFGNEFLVAPMITPDAVTRTVYLPAGEWIDFFSNQVHPGGANIQWNNGDQTQFPLFVRQGAIVPMLLDDADTLCDANYVNNPAIKSATTDLLLNVYPGGDSGFTMYDGTDIQSSVAGGVTTITITSTPRKFELHVLMATPSTVTLNSAATPFTTAAPFVNLDFSHAGEVSVVVLTL